MQRRGTRFSNPVRHWVVHIPDPQGQVLRDRSPGATDTRSFRLPLLANATDIFVLHEVEPGRIGNDIWLFFKHHFSELGNRRGGLDGWPTEGDLDILCKRAAGLFVYATATVKFIDCRIWNPRVQFDLIVQSPDSSIYEGTTELNPNKTLDSLHMSILQEAFGRNLPERDPEIRSALGAVILVANPLPPSAIATLLSIDPQSVSLQLSSIHLLLIQEDADSPVRPFHKSFPDFIVDPTRCTNERFCIPPPNHHLELLLGCLELMDETLEMNMFYLPPTAANDEVNDLHLRAERRGTNTSSMGTPSVYPKLLPLSITSWRTSSCSGWRCLASSVSQGKRPTH